MNKWSINQENDNTENVSFLPSRYDYILLSFPRFLTSYLITLNCSAVEFRGKIDGNIDNRVAAVLRKMGYLKFRYGYMDEVRIILERFIKVRKLNHTDDAVGFVNTLCLIGTIFRSQDHLEEVNDIILANGLVNKVPQSQATIEYFLKRYKVVTA